MYFVSSFMHRV